MNFWQQPLNTLSDEEWEKLCDGCGQCCHQSYEDEETGELFASNIACALFDAKSCRCSDYTNRQQRVQDCLNIRNLKQTHYHWLPAQCAYRLRALDLPLPAWHPLRSGDINAVHDAEISMRM